jgi:hypothetical protein
MSEKIQKLAKKMEGLFPNTNTPQELYDLLTNLMKNQKDYFYYLGREDVVKLLFYIWSLKKSNGFIIGEKLLNNISFAALFVTFGEIHKEYCSTCNGNGDVMCDYCEGNGTLECESCDGNGSTTCGECDGDGRQMGDGEWEDCEECNGEGELTCNNCGGEGRADCDYCSNGRRDCDNCGGSGEVDTNEKLYTEYFIVTWNKEIQNRCEITEGTADVTMSEYEFDKLRDDYVVLSVDDMLHENLEDFILEGEMYCSLYTDNPKMYFTSRMNLTIDEDNMYFYKKN